MDSNEYVFYIMGLSDVVEFVMNAGAEGDIIAIDNEYPNQMKRVIRALNTLISMVLETHKLVLWT